MLIKVTTTTISEIVPKKDIGGYLNVKNKKGDKVNKIPLNKELCAALIEFTKNP